MTRYEAEARIRQQEEAIARTRAKIHILNAELQLRESLLEHSYLDPASDTSTGGNCLTEADIEAQEGLEN